MNKSVINALISRIDYYISASNITNSVEANQLKKNIKDLEKYDDLYHVLEVSRNFDLFSLRMGEKRTTVKMYLERDIEYINELLNGCLKNNGRNFVDTMKSKVLVNKRPSYAFNN